MAKTLKEVPITTRAARARLSAGIFFRALTPDVHLGYRKRRPDLGGEWFVRWRRGLGYSQATLAAADDLLEADGSKTLNFEQAKAGARDHVVAARAEETAAADGPAETVRSAIGTYTMSRTARENDRATASSKKDALSRLGRHVLTDPIADVELHRLNADHIRKWRERTADKKLAPATIQRLVNDFRAALNVAALTHRQKLPVAFELTVKDGFKNYVPLAVVARQGQILTDEEIRAVIKAAWVIDAESDHDGDLGRIIMVMAATGARFSQVKRLRIADVQPSLNRLMIPVSAKGRGQKSQTHIAVPVSSEVLVALKPAIAGRKNVEPLLLRWRWKQVNKIEWVRDLRGPWNTPSELTRSWAKIIDRAELPADTVQYAMRHSSIVRGLRRGLPIRLVAALHDTSSEMIEKHYSAYIVDSLSELASRAVIEL